MERMYFFDSTQDDQRIYQAADLARYHAQIIGNGVSNTANLPDLEVTAKTNMDVALGAGYMFANGYMYENDSTMTLTHPIADPNNDRIDRVVICFDNNPAERRIYAYVKQGVPGANPTPPTLQRDEYVHEMSVAQVRIIAGKSFIEQSEITDERTNGAVCGYIPLHNIYRGIGVNKYGNVTMPNQSYVDVRNNGANITIDNTETQLPFGVINKDKQNEVSGNIFIPKADGVYFLWLMIRAGTFDHVGDSKVDVQFFLERNGVNYSYPFIAHVTTEGDDNIWIGTMIEELKAGDNMSVMGLITNPQGKTFNISETWLRIAKVS